MKVVKLYSRREDEAVAQDEHSEYPKEDGGCGNQKDDFLISFKLMLDEFRYIDKDYCPRPVSYTHLTLPTTPYV